jgi:arylsulfatase A-like enzyme
MANRRNFLKKIGYGTLIWTFFPYLSKCTKTSSSWPNILWLSCEDISPNLGCYGDKYAKTPTLDQLASSGVLYTNAYTVAGVCAPNRSSIITGVFASTLGTQNMRSGGEGVDRSDKPHLPPSVKCFSEFLREAGYYCTNNAKEDYNFVTPPTAWNESSNRAHWKNRPAGKPFFAVFNYGGTHEGSIRLNEVQRAERTRRLTPEQRQDRQKLELPPYYPDTPTTREYWARYYELITAMDYWVDDQLKEIKNAGLSEDTIVFFWSDHGVGMPRAKRWIYDSGTHIPLIVYIPKKFRSIAQKTPGIKDDQLINSIDFAPTVLNLAGLPIPAYLQGRPFLGKNLPPERQFVYGIRDRMDERYDTIRSVRDKRYRYLVNYRCFKPYYQYMQSAEQGPVMKEIRRLEQVGELPEKVALFTARQKPPEELYDVQNDPHEVDNLANKPEFLDILKKMRDEHLKWMLQTRDTGLIPEAEIVELEKQLGSRMAILQQPDSEEFLKELQKVALLAGKPDQEDQKVLENYLDNKHPAIRFWAVTGIGNLVDKNHLLITKIERKVSDESPIVRVALARTLFKMGKLDKALPILRRELKSDQEWVRLSAAIVLDEMGDASRALIPEMQQALEDKENKYVVRVVNHALNNLLDTNKRVR